MELNISPKFTIDDIHKISEFHYEITKNMNSQDKRNLYNKQAVEICKKWKFNTVFEDTDKHIY